jgi:hypothetical protein
MTDDLVRPNWDKLIELLLKWPPENEYFHKDENGKTIIDIEKIKRDKDKFDFTAGSTPIMFKKEDIKKED